MHEADNAALRAWVDNTEGPLPAGITAGFLVILDLPGHMSPEDAKKCLKTCISFGKPEISLSFVIEDRTEEEGSYTSIGMPRNPPASAG